MHRPPVQQERPWYMAARPRRNDQSTTTDFVRQVSYEEATPPPQQRSHRNSSVEAKPLSAEPRRRVSVGVPDAKVRVSWHSLIDLRQNRHANWRNAQKIRPSYPNRIIQSDEVPSRKAWTEEDIEDAPRPNPRDSSRYFDSRWKDNRNQYARDDNRWRHDSERFSRTSCKGDDASRSYWSNEPARESSWREWNVDRRLEEHYRSRGDYGPSPSWDDDKGHHQAREDMPRGDSSGAKRPYRDEGTIRHWNEEVPSRYPSRSQHANYQQPEILDTSPVNQRRKHSLGPVGRESYRKHSWEPLVRSFASLKEEEKTTTHQPREEKPATHLPRQESPREKDIRQQRQSPKKRLRNLNESESNSVNVRESHVAARPSQTGTDSLNQNKTVVAAPTAKRCTWANDPGGGPSTLSKEVAENPRPLTVAGAQSATMVLKGDISQSRPVDQDQSNPYVTPVVGFSSPALSSKCQPIAHVVGTPITKLMAASLDLGPTSPLARLAPVRVSPRNVGNMSNERFGDITRRSSLTPSEDSRMEQTRISGSTEIEQVPHVSTSVGVPDRPRPLDDVKRSTPPRFSCSRENVRNPPKYHTEEMLLELSSPRPQASLSTPYLPEAESGKRRKLAEDDFGEEFLCPIPAIQRAPLDMLPEESEPVNLSTFLSKRSPSPTIPRKAKPSGDTTPSGKLGTGASDLEDSGSRLVASGVRNRRLTSKLEDKQRQRVSLKSPEHAESTPMDQVREATEPGPSLVDSGGFENRLVETGNGDENPCEEEIVEQSGKRLSEAILRVEKLQAAISGGRVIESPGVNSAPVEAPVDEVSVEDPSLLDSGRLDAWKSVATAFSGCINDGNPEVWNQVVQGLENLFGMEENDSSISGGFSEDHDEDDLVSVLVDFIMDISDRQEFAGPRALEIDRTIQVAFTSAIKSRNMSVIVQFKNAETLLELEGLEKFQCRETFGDTELLNDHDFKLKFTSEGSRMYCWHDANRPADSSDDEQSEFEGFRRWEWLIDIEPSTKKVHEAYSHRWAREVKALEQDRVVIRGQQQRWLSETAVTKDDEFENGALVVLSQYRKEDLSVLPSDWPWAPKGLHYMSNGKLDRILIDSMGKYLDVIGYARPWTMRRTPWRREEILITTDNRNRGDIAGTPQGVVSRAEYLYDLRVAEMSLRNEVHDITDEPTDIEIVNARRPKIGGKSSLVLIGPSLGWAESALMMFGGDVDFAGILMSSTIQIENLYRPKYELDSEEALWTIGEIVDFLEKLSHWNADFRKISRGVPGKNAGDFVRLYYLIKPWVTEFEPTKSSFIEWLMQYLPTEEFSEYHHIYTDPKNDWFSVTESQLRQVLSCAKRTNLPIEQTSDNEVDSDFEAQVLPAENAIDQFPPHTSLLLPLSTRCVVTNIATTGNRQSQLSAFAGSGVDPYEVVQILGDLVHTTKEPVEEEFEINTELINLLTVMTRGTYASTGDPELDIMRYVFKSSN